MATETEEKKSTSFKPVFSKGMLIAGFLGIGVGIWSLARGQTVTGGLLLALCSIIIGMQFYARAREKQS